MSVITPLHCFSLEEFKKLNTLEEYKYYCKFLKPYCAEDIKKYGIDNNLLFTKNKAYYYKNKIYFNFYNFCVNYYINIQDKNIDDYIYFFQELIETDKGQYLLKKINLSGISNVYKKIY